MRVDGTVHLAVEAFRKYTETRLSDRDRGDARAPNHQGNLTPNEFSRTSTSQQAQNTNGTNLRLVSHGVRPNYNDQPTELNADDLLHKIAQALLSGAWAVRAGRRITLPLSSTLRFD